MIPDTRRRMKPSAKMPTASRPHTPAVPCTEDAPTGSSIFSRCSTTWTLTSISTAATAPMITAAQGATKAQGAVMPTSPARAPLLVLAALMRPCAPGRGRRP